jgi:hypothetical protein
LLEEHGVHRQPPADLEQAHQVETFSHYGGSISMDEHHLLICSWTTDKIMRVTCPTIFFKLEK